MASTERLIECLGHQIAEAFVIRIIHVQHGRLELLVRFDGSQLGCEQTNEETIELRVSAKNS
jgi:hypothetical protein